MNREKSFKSISIMLIDDDEDDYVHIRDLLKEIQGAQYTFDWMASYDAGLEYLKQNNPDICLLDYRLGEHTGLDLLLELQKLEAHCPVIFLTGFGDRELDMQAMQYGASDYLVKNQMTSPLLERSIRYSLKKAFDMKELQEREQSFKTLFHSTFEGIIVHKSGVMLDVNEAAGSIFQIEPGAMVGASLFQYFRTDQREPLAKKLSSNTKERTEFFGLKSDGNEITVECSTRTVNLNGERVSLLAVQDISERKVMEAQILQQDRLASLGLLASSLAHEIGTPIGIIRGRAELVSRVAEERVKQDMDLIIAQIDRVTQLVQSLLQLARGRTPGMVSTVSLEQVIQGELRLLSHELARKDIRLDLKIEGNPHARAEHGPLGQVFLNLLINAVHAIEEVQQSGIIREHRISITLREGEDTADMVIEDTGNGILEKNMNQLFKPFFTTKPIGSGTGLGLATSYKLVQSWGGMIKVQSKPSQGARFIITLPKASLIN